MRSEHATSPQAEVDTSDEEIVTWWGLVIEGYHVTQERVMSEIGERFALTPGAFDILLRLVRSPDQRMPMTRLAREAALSSGGFTKIADRLAAAGLIRREPCATDRRVTYAVLTDHGVVQPEPIEDPERLPVVPRGDEDLVPARLDPLDDRPQDEWMSRGGAVDPDPHPRDLSTAAASGSGQ